jgi:thymidylate synthase
MTHQPDHFSIPTNSVMTSCFSKAYPLINNHLMDNGSSVSSRYGHTKEILNFKTEITNPYKRCVGGYERDVNIFFLMAEALWIFAGQKDVEFLTIFNKRMTEFSDDGKNFHSPYGFRLRHFGVSSDSKVNEDSSIHSNQGIDQIETAIRMFSKNNEDRRVAMEIWDAHLDLETVSKDIPCNDLILMKIREDLLHTTVENRSNDLHWGLPTNVYQFSFISEMIASCLGVKLGTQTHNSQSLHFYLENPIAMNLYENHKLALGQGGLNYDLYDYSYSLPFEFKFKSDEPVSRLYELDSYINLVLSNLRNYNKNGIRLSSEASQRLINFSPILYAYNEILQIYIDYSKRPKDDMSRICSIKELMNLHNTSVNYKKVSMIDFLRWDIVTLGINFFCKRIKDRELLADFYPKEAANWHLLMGKY